MDKQNFVSDKEGNRIPMTPVSVDGKILFTSASFGKFNELFPTLSEFRSRPTDIWIYGCPKSGNNWTGEIVNLILNGKANDKPLVEYSLDASTSIDKFDKEFDPRIMNVHIPMRYLPPQIKDYSKLIYIVRNPLAVALSMYHHVSKLPYMAYKGSPEMFIKSFSSSLFSFFGTWFDHVKQVIEASQRQSNILVVYYEEMKESPESNIQTIARFLGKELTAENLMKIVQQTSIDYMKDRFTKSPGHQTILGKPVPATVFLRKGEIAEWRNYVSEAFLIEFRQRFEKEMKDYPQVMQRIKLN